MSLFRSERMGYYHITMPREGTWDVLNELGQKGYNQFIDMNPNEPFFNRPFSGQIKRLEELELKVRTIEGWLDRFELPVVRCEDFHKYLEDLSMFLKNRNQAEITYIEEVESEINKKYSLLDEQLGQYSDMKNKHQYLYEYKQVLIQCKEVLGSYGYIAEYAPENDEIRGENENINLKGTQLQYIAGVISNEQILRFKRMVFRSTKGNNWLYTSEIADDSQSKTVFIIVYQGGAQDVLGNKLRRICDSLGANKYQVPQDYQSFKSKDNEIDSQQIDLNNLLQLTKKNILEQLYRYSDPRYPGAQCSYLEELRLFLVKEKTLYINMNYLQQNTQLNQGYCWMPLEDEDNIRRTINDLVRNKPNIAGIDLKKMDKSTCGMAPPTHFKMNSFTAPFQEIVNTYGIPRYREINPGLFAISFFPFLFGVMFGDIGHGGALMLFGLYLILNAESIQKAKSGLLPLVELRYLLFIMGVFACYAGFIYNDFLAIPWNMFGSCYENDEHGKYANKKANCVYPLGIDPKWYISSNELQFFNSLKMKMAVIIGVLQMSFGVILKGLNSIHFNLGLDFFFEFIPQLVFMQVTFGYMCFCIIYKWLTPWENFDLLEHPAPGIINILINMPLRLGATDGQPLYDNAIQETVQFRFFITALIMVPIMLLIKPLILLIKNSGSKPDHKINNEQEEPLIEQTTGHGGHGGHGENFEFGEVFVHQVIETIEFVLGSISNTASYLRLWALSLAHGQLAKVFFEKTLGGGLMGGSFVMVFIGYFLFINITFAVIMCMDMMECFLHALRLQWVEFQNKFYKADGYKYIPFDFVKHMELESDKIKQ